METGWSRKPSISYPWLSTIYSLLVGLAGLGALAYWLAGDRDGLPWLPSLIFTGLSLLAQRSSFHLGSPVMHNLAGVIDVAAVLALGPAAGALVAASSGFAHLELNALRHRKLSRRDLVQVPLFDAGLKALMALLGGVLYRSLNGPLPLSSLEAQTALSAGVVCLVWFALHHMGWGIWDYLDGGPEQLHFFVQDAFSNALLIELLPLPFSVVVALVYNRLNWAAFALLAMAVVAVSVLTKRWADTRHQLLQRVAELSTIEQVGRAIAQAQFDVDELCKLMYERACQIVDTTIFHLGLFDGDAYTLKLWISEGKPEPQRTFHLRPDEGLISWLRESKQPILVRDFLKEMDSLPARPTYVSDNPPRSALYVPLIAGEMVMGAMSIQSFRPHAYGGSDLRVLSAMANQAAVAIQKARLYETESQQAWLSTVLLQVADSMSQVSDLDAVLATIVRLIPILVGVERSAILLWEPDTETFVPAQTYGLSPELRETFEHTRFSAGAVPALDLIRWDKSPLLVESARDGLLVPRDMAETFNIHEMLLLPLLAQGELLGVMMVDYAGRAHSFSQRMIDMLTGIANQAAMVIQSARLVQAQQEEAYVSMALLQVAEAISRSTDLEETLATVARITPMLVGVEACAIFLWDPDAAVFSPFQQYGLKGETRTAFWQLRLGKDNPLVSELVADRSPVSADDLPEGNLFHAGSLLALPMVSRGEVVGVMIVDLDGSTHRWRQRWAGFLTGIAGQAAIAVENDRLLREAAEQERIRQELVVAQRIQASFLPECCPHLPGWELAAIWRSARQVGGDFYDFIPLPPDAGAVAGRMGLVIADVADKGVPAALFMALSRTLVRTVAIDGRPPASAVARANDLILADARSDLFVTLFYAILHPESGEIAYVSAGHMPPLVSRAANGAIEELRSPGMALAVLPGIEFEERTARLDPGDALVLYTDGVIEASDARQRMFGRERLMEVLRAHPTGSAEELAETIDQVIIAFVGDAPQFDDFTLVVAKRLA